MIRWADARGGADAGGRHLRGITQQKYDTVKELHSKSMVYSTPVVGERRRRRRRRRRRHPGYAPLEAALQRRLRGVEAREALHSRLRPLRAAASDRAEAARRGSRTDERSQPESLVPERCQASKCEDAKAGAGLAHGESDPPASWREGSRSRLQAAAQCWRRSGSSRPWRRPAQYPPAPL